MTKPTPQVAGPHRLIGSVALLLVVLALIGNVAVFAWIRPYGILRDLKVLATAREQVHYRYVDEADDDALIDAALRGMIDSLGDQNSQYLSEEDLQYFNEHVHGEFTGIGAEIDIHENRLRIIAPLDDSPAWKSGAQPGDIVLEIDGEDTLGIDVFDAMTRLKGPEGTDVKIKVRHRDGRIQDLTITRGKIEVLSVRGYRRNPGNGFDHMIDPQGGIAYLRLTQFGDKSYAEVSSTLEGLKNSGIQALILDLRNNGGGLLDAAVAISDLFLTPGQTIVSTQGRTEPKTVVVSTAETLLPETPLVVLVNENSASASEILAGAMLDNQRGLIVGTRTFGKGSVQQILPLEGSFENMKRGVKLTTAYWYIPSGRMIHRIEGADQWGVDPSPGSYVPMDDDAVRAMLMKRRASEADDPYAELDGPITPQWVRDELLDDQLAAALEAAQKRLATGAWPKVGIDLEAVLTEPTEAELLERRRKELVEMLEQVERQIESLGDTAGGSESPTEPIEIESAPAQ